MSLIFVSDQNECEQNPNVCGANTNCEDKLPPTKYECYCDPGYKPKDGSITECEGLCHSQLKDLPILIPEVVKLFCQFLERRVI